MARQHPEGRLLRDTGHVECRFVQGGYNKLLLLLPSTHHVGLIVSEGECYISCHHHRHVPWWADVSSGLLCARQISRFEDKVSGRVLDQCSAIFPRQISRFEDAVSGRVLDQCSAIFPRQMCSQPLRKRRGCRTKATRKTETKAKNNSIRSSSSSSKKN